MRRKFILKGGLTSPSRYAILRNVNDSERIGLVVEIVLHA
jgi:hypothetical protein